MKLILLFGILFFSAFAMQMDWGMCGHDVQHVRDCMFLLFDTNTDNQIELSEVASAVSGLALDTQNTLMMLCNQTEYPTVADCAGYHFDMCDFDEDGVITMNDFTAENATCLQPGHLGLDTLCMHCIHNGYDVSEDMALARQAEKARQEALLRRRQK